MKIHTDDNLSVEFHQVFASFEAVYKDTIPTIGINTAILKPIASPYMSAIKPNTMDPNENPRSKNEVSIANPKLSDCGRSTNTSTTIEDKTGNRVPKPAPYNIAAKRRVR